MKGDFTRRTYRRWKHYREVNMQQGRTQLDADWNEQNSINFHYETAALQDVIGKSGTPVDSETGYSDGFQIRITNALVTPSSGTPGSLFTVDGYGFMAGETVTLALRDGAGSFIPYGDPSYPWATQSPGATAGADGSFSSTFAFPSTASAGTYTLVATGATSGDFATATFDLTSSPTLEMSPASGAPGLQVTARGYGFTAGEAVTSALSCNTGLSIPNATAGTDGSFSSTFVFPSTASAGTYTLTATGASSGSPATASFVLAPTSIALTPSSGPPGSRFKVGVYGFPAADTVSLTLSGSTGVYIQPSTLQPDGSLTSSFILPPSTVPGTYTVTATGAPSGDIATASLFVLPYFPSLGYTIRHGHYYVDGILCENEADVGADQQPDLPLFQGTSGALLANPGDYIVYLDVWERHLTYLDDPEIREVALLGPDTATRTKIVWQVKLLPVRRATFIPAPRPAPAPGRTVAGAGSVVVAPPATSLTASLDAIAVAGNVGITHFGVEIDCLTEFPEWDALISPSSGRLTARAKPTEPTGDPCEVPAEAGYTSLENQLYRVEIHNGGQLGLLVTVNGYGFSAGEIVTLSLSGSTGLPPWTVTAGADGSFTSSFVFPPSVPPGTYVLTATGTSGDTQKASFNLAAVPALELSPGSGAPGPLVRANGYGFLPGEIVTLSLSGSTGVTPRTVIVGPDGTFTSSFIFPASTPPGTYVLTAMGTSGDTQTASFSLTQTAVEMAPSSGASGLEVDVAAYGFSAGETVSFALSGGTGVVVPSATVGARGAFTSFALPPSTPAGTYVLTATGGTSGLVATASIDLPFVKLTPSSGGLGQDTSAMPTFKWSRDNGVVVSAISFIDTSNSGATVLTVGGTGKNPNLSFLNNMWVEVTSDINDLWGLPGSLALVTAVNSPAKNTITIDPGSVVGSAITDTDYPPDMHPKVRRWDWDHTSPSPPPYPLVAQVPPGNDGYIELEDGVEVRFSGGTYRTGDYWLIPARTATADVDWPEYIQAVNWGSVESGGSGSDAATLASFLVQRYGLEGIQASDFTPNGPSEVDAAYTDPSGVSHNLAIALNDEKTVATLTVDGIVGAEIPVLTEGDGTMMLQCGLPEPLPPEGIEHQYARLAIIGYDPITLAGPAPVVRGTPGRRAAPAAPASGSVVVVSVSPQSATVAPGKGTTAQVTISAPASNAQAVFMSSATASAPSGVTAVLTGPSTHAIQPGGSQTASLSVSTDPGVALGNYTVTISWAGSDDSGSPVSASGAMTVTVSGQSFKSPLLLLTDCRRLFPALVDVPRLFYVSGDGQTANPGGTLPFPLMAATWFGSVRFTIVQGGGTLTNPNVTPSSATGAGGFLDVKPGSGTPDPSSFPDLDGIAWCTWTIDSTPAQLVRAELLDIDGNLTDEPPLYYTVVQPAQQGGTQSNGNTGLLELAVNISMVTGNPQIFGPFKHSLAVQVPPAVILGYVGYMTPGGATPWGGGRVAAMEDAGLYPFGSSDKRFVPPIPYFKAVFIDQNIFCVIVENVTLPTTQDNMLLVLRWWAIPGQDSGVTSPGPAKGASMPPFVGPSPWWNNAVP